MNLNLLFSPSFTELNWTVKVALFSLIILSKFYPNRKITPYRSKGLLFHLSTSYSYFLSTFQSSGSEMESDSELRKKKKKEKRRDLSDNEDEDMEEGDREDEEDDDVSPPHKKTKKEKRKDKVC